MDERLHSLLHLHFGYNEFRGRQEEIILHTLAGNNSLVIMPTGGGKSLCFQLPALAMEGTALVISPLISLMQDQVDSLRVNGIPAAAYNSAASPEEIKIIKKDLGTESLKLLYVSPEKAIQPDFLQEICDKKISLIAIDESHCVSMWGNDFRKDYTLLTVLLDRFTSVPVMALTATADKVTQDDILVKLAMPEARKFIESFERPNLTIGVAPAAGRLHHIIEFVTDRSDEAGIIYCLSRKSTEMVASKLQERGIGAAFYHAEMSNEKRQQVQRAFQNDEIQVICATIAFGMGIDKSNVRYVLHYNLPKNLESYYQEIGRAGRDGLPAETILYFSTGDSHILRKFIEDSSADEMYKSVQKSKLNRIIEYGQATSCRTNIILNYFGEFRSKPCGHCDNCLIPADKFDGTLLARKALSAVKRMRERAGITMLADVLRGSRREGVLRMNFDKIKTYGAGSDVTRADWLFYISQMINLGLLEINYSEFNRLIITQPGEDVLYGRSMIELSRPAPQEEPKITKAPQDSVFDNDLFEKLRHVRQQLAEQQNVPPYVIFHDATLREMSSKKPTSLTTLAGITGVGSYKLMKYGNQFLEIIQKHQPVKKVLGDTVRETHALFLEGLSAEEIAEKRDLTTGTIVSHFLKLHEAGVTIDLLRDIPEKDLEEIKKAREELPDMERLSELYDRLQGKYSYNHLKLALAHKN